MANQVEKVDTQNQPGSDTPAPPLPADASEEAALELGEIRVTKPLRIPDDEMGGDPYNHTGRFSTDD